nr:sensor histidine kinase [[Clostridium] dakarense]
MILFTVSILVPLIICLILFFNYFNNLLTKQNMNSFENTLNSVSNNIDTYLNDLQRLTLTPYMYNEIFEYMSYLNSSIENRNLNNINLYNLNKDYSSTLNKLINSSRKDILSITFIPESDPSKSYLVSKYYNILSEVPSPKYYNDWIKSTLEADGGTYFTPVHNTKYPNSQNEYKVFSLMRVVKNLDTKKVLGIIKVDAEESTIKEIISTINISENSQLLLLDEDKQTIYSTHQNGKSAEYNTQNHNVLEKKIASNDWTLLYLDSKQDLYSKTMLMAFMLLLIGILFVIISLLFFKIRSRSIINSIYQITSNIEQLETGDLSIDSNISGTYEFEHISNAINKISYKIKLHAKNEYEAIINKKKAEYIALQTQINPHFLNNILNGFVALNRLNEKQLLEDSLIQLSQFYRYTCKNSDISTLEEEFNCIEKYLSLEKLRFDDLIDFELNLSNNTKNIKVPKLILQPLVENCIKHGFKDSGEPILIKVSSIIENDNQNYNLIISICDNGVGFDTNSSGCSDSTGIKNIVERLHLFENDSQLNISSTLGVGTNCIVKLPLKEDLDYDYIIS